MTEIRTCFTHIVRVSLCWKTGDTAHACASPMIGIRCCTFKFGNERMAMEPQSTPTTLSIDSSNHDGIYRPRSGVALEKHYSVLELAKRWELSERTIRRIFSSEPGVLQLMHEESRFKRGYSTLRIPESVVQRVHRRLQGID